MTDDFNPNDSAPLPGGPVMPALDREEPAISHATRTRAGMLLESLSRNVRQFMVGSISPDGWGNPQIQRQRDEWLERELAYRGSPSNPKNAARAGWYAGIRHALQVKAALVTRQQKMKMAIRVQERAAEMGKAISINTAHKLLAEVLDEFNHLEHPYDD